MGSNYLLMAFGHLQSQEVVITVTFTLPDPPCCDRFALLGTNFNVSSSQLPLILNAIQLRCLRNGWLKCERGTQLVSICQGVNFSRLGGLVLGSKIALRGPMASDGFVPAYGEHPKVHLTAVTAGTSKKAK